MMHVFFWLFLGFLLLILLVLWSHHSFQDSPTAERLDQVQDALTTLHLAVPLRALAERIFALDDRTFVARQGSQKIHHRFLAERRKLALTWLRHTRAKVREVMQLYRVSAGRSAHLRLGVEFALATQYAVFLMVHTVLHFMIWLRGPFATRQVVGYACGLAERLVLEAGPWVVETDGSRLEPLAGDWAKS